MSWDTIFSLTNAIAMIGWVMLAVLPRKPLVLSSILYLGVGLLCLAYLALFVSLFGNLVDPDRIPGTPEPDLLDYSIAGLRPLFMSDGGIVIGWTHYLAFDLFVGLWIARDADSKGVGRLVQLPFLFLTLMAGPIGLLSWLGFRGLRARAMSGRLDNFTDAAFAFAVTLLIIGGGSSIGDSDALLVALGDLPAFAFGFAIITMFWIAHVRWRSIRGDGDWIGVVLTLLLVFLILIYVQPLRAMAAATSIWFTGQGGGFRGSVSTLFTIYGTGFVAMSLTTSALFTDALRSNLDMQQRAHVRGDRAIWLILAATGLISIGVSFTRFGPMAAMVYATLPLIIGLFAWRYDWDGKTAR